MTDSYSALAPLNATLNTTSAVLLLAGLWCIRRRRLHAHRLCMLSAVVVSSAFLVSYIVYHYHVGDVPFLGSGWVRPVYFTILISHVALAGAIVPLVIVTLWRALGGRFAAHRRIARWTWPLWMYVSVTGVVVYAMVYVLYPHSAPVTAAPAPSRSAANRVTPSGTP